ncbi:conserved hypothetical protein [Hyella patelloides LEGE 07179]|uniref:DUF928 domain-containing protein n=1 Tax=Hyella patelloides LEGE 07179 TaxID=945734 RepID=A0A563VXL4_9CYAN|nr:DUF928 domain-containing protein [Hyella patelloides]VEP16161.1 conserved hypothetical protein [Hyella patelloides LEGE 07179]
MKLSTEKKKSCLKFNKNWKLLFFSTVLSYLLLSIVIANCFAKDKTTELDTTVLFQPPPESEQPENTDSAASRIEKPYFQDCIATQDQELSVTDQTMTPIVPNENYGLTLKERPTFWVYLPQTSARQVILSIKEEGATPHWQQSIEVTKEEGIVGIKLADDAPILEAGKNYQWAVILVCENRPNPNDPVVTSWIKRIDKSQIKEGDLSTTATELEKAASYARQGIWYDALDILIAVKESSINNWQDIWLRYLQSGGLTEIANEPIIIE